MKAIKNILVLTLLIIHCSLFIAQAQVRQDRSIIRGNVTSITVKYPGDITTDSLFLQVRTTSSFTSTIHIAKENTVAGGSDAEILATYSYPYTSVKIFFSSANTSGMAIANYYYDLRKSVSPDSAVLVYGTFKVQSYAGEVVNGLAGGGSSESNIKTWISDTADVIRGELADYLLEVDTLSLSNRIDAIDMIAADSTDVQGMISDTATVLRGELLANDDSTAQRVWSDLKYVDKTTAQTIAGIKTFDDTLKINKQLSFTRTQAGVWNYPLKFNPIDTYLGDYSIRFGEIANSTYAHPQWSLYQGYNITETAQAPISFYTAMELGWESDQPVITGDIVDEYWFGWVDSLEGFQYRPFNLQMNRKNSRIEGSINASRFSLANPKATILNLDYFSTGAHPLLAHEYPSWTSEFNAYSSYGILAAPFKFFSIAERDSNWLFQQGYPLLNFGSYSGGSAVWLNPEFTTTRIGYNLMVYSNSADTKATYFYNIGADSNETGTSLNFQSETINFLDTLGSTAFSFNTSTKNFGLGATSNFYSLAARNEAWLYQDGYELIRFGIHGVGTDEGSTVWVNPDPTFTITRLGQNLLAWSQPSETRRAGFYVDAKDSVFLNSEIFLGANKVVFQDSSGQEAFSFNTETKEVLVDGSPVTFVPDTAGITDGYTPKYIGGNVVWSPDISTSGSGTFNPDGVTIDTTAGGLARVLPAKVTKWDSVTTKITATQASNLISDSLAQYYLAPATVGSMAYSSDGTTWSVVTADVSPAQLDETYAALSHTHSEFADTVRVASWSMGMGNTDLDTLTTGSFGGIKIENNYTITEVSAYTNSGTITFNIEERGETTPNTSGVDVITSDLVADDNQQETSTFSNAAIDRDDWLILTIVSITGDPTIFSVTVRGVKTN